MKLSDVVALINLPDLIFHTCGADAAYGLSPERGGVIRDPRPNHTETRPSFSVYLYAGRWRWKRHDGSDTQHGSAYDFLLSLGYSEAQAREELERLAGVASGWTLPTRPRVVYTPPSALDLARQALSRCTPLDAETLSKVARITRPLVNDDPAAQDLRARGLLGWNGVQVGTLRCDFQTRDGRTLAHRGALCFLLNGPDGKPWGLKVRNLGSAEELAAAGTDRYVYRIAGHGAPAWCSPAYGQGSALLIVEGELNGAAAKRATQAVGLSLDVQGLAGAGGVPHLEGMAGRVLNLYFDPDKAGSLGRERVAQIAVQAGAAEVRVLTSLADIDFCEALRRIGAEIFGEWLQANLDSARVFSGARDLRPGTDSGPVPVSKTMLSGSVENIWGQKRKTVRAVWNDRRGRL